MRKIIELGLTVAHAISYAHANLVIHRDLKASNILVDDNGHVNVVDFGIASSEHEQFDNSLRVYTPEIASPEQILGEKITVTTDIFSLAATLLTLLLQKKSLPDVNPKNYEPINDEKYIKKILSQSSLPYELKLIFKKALQIKSSNRYDNMNSFAADLSNWLRNKPISILAHSKYYLIEKFIHRNPMSTAIISLALLMLLISLAVIINYAQTSAKAAKRADASFNFLSDILIQADPFQTRQGEITIKEILETKDDIPIESVQGDEELKLELHQKISEIYSNLGLFDKAFSQNNLSLQIAKTIYKPNDSKLLKIMNYQATLLSSTGKFEEAIMVLNEVIKDIKKYNLHDPDLLLEAYTLLLKPYSQIIGKGTYNQEKLDQVIAVVQNMVESKEITDIQIKINALNDLAQAMQTNKEYLLAESYYIQSFALIEANEGKQSLTYQYSQLDFAVFQAISGCLAYMVMNAFIK